MGLLALNGDVLSYLPCVAPGCDYKSYMERIAQNRPVFVSRKMGYSCEEVRDRILPKYPMEKIEHGVAHARDYEFIEEELRSNYHWQNHFCYTLDTSKSKENATLRFAKGVVQASLSRAAVDWMVNRVNLTTLIENINQEPFSDELLIQSLQITDEFDMPGRFSYECSQTGSAGTITRLTHWIMGSPNDCLSGHVRHDICIMGVEHIPELSRTPHILVNKMMPDFDYGAIECVHELVFNRTFRNQVDHALNRSHYSNLAHVIYHKNRHDPSWLSSLNCSNLVRPYRRLLPKSFPERDY
ncbi:hypothetical protein RB195_016842 [Necator americanus]|uniref:Uncharacterized protein n=1 Tax=Necator americanus TaxID=51031 RepID=A0ABR1C5K2_NECAM